MADDIDRVLMIAQRYGIRVDLVKDNESLIADQFWYGRFRSGWSPKERRGLPVSRPPQKATPGPQCHYADVTTQRVWFSNMNPDAVETHLHEICHVIAQPPMMRIDRVWEDAFLMPFERVLARQCLSDVGYRKVVSWQESTQIEWWLTRPVEKLIEALDGFDGDYTRTTYWRESHAALKAMGAIRNGRVTWRLWNWSRCPKGILERARQLV